MITLCQSQLGGAKGARETAKQDLALATRSTKGSQVGPEGCGGSSGGLRGSSSATSTALLGRLMDRAGHKKWTQVCTGL